MLLAFRQRVKRLGGGFEVYSLYRHLVEKLEPDHSFLLESKAEDTKEPLFSYICLEPDFLLQIDEEKLSFPEVLSERGEKIIEFIQHQEDMDNEGKDIIDDRVEYNIKALYILSKAFPRNDAKRPKNFERQIFYGGFLGYLGWDILAPWVGFKRRAATPDILLSFNTKVLIYDHGRKELYLVDNALPGEDLDRDDYTSALEGYRRRGKLRLEGIDAPSIRGISNTSQEEFQRMVERVKNYIYAGDIFQAVVSRRIDIPKVEVGDLEIYEVLRELNPSPYLYYLDFGRQRFIGSSPEALVTVNGRRMTTVPIAGTRRRGRTREEDKVMEEELMNDPKERAEHVMLVDLARNDLAKVAEPGTVRATTFMALRRYGHVMHMVTMVEGLLRNGLNPLDVLKSVFPAGTVSGAPKLRAMEIIAEQEREARGPYAGAIGYLSMNMDCDWAINIRTIQLLDDVARIQVGSGIVADSQPRLEWLETRNKAESLLKAILIAEGNAG